MIFTTLLACFTSLINLIINILPNTPTTEVALQGFLGLINTGVNLFGLTTFTIIISNIVFWSIFHITWAIIEWIYIKIPGVN